MSKHNFINAKQVREYLRESGAAGVSPSVIKVLNKIVKELSDKAYERSKANQRTTVMDRDY